MRAVSPERSLVRALYFSHVERLCALILGVCFSAYSWAQEPISALSPIPLSSVTQETNAQERPLALFNLIRFKGRAQQWDGAQVELKYTLDEEEYTVIQRRSASSVAQGELSLPPLDYAEVGQFKSLDTLVNHKWVVWIPSSTRRLDAGQRAYLKQTLNVITAASSPEDEVLLFGQQSYPRLISSVTRDQLDVDALEILQAPPKQNTRRRSRSSRQTRRDRGTARRGAPHSTRRGSPMWSPTAQGLSELLTALNIHLTKTLSSVDQDSYQCGVACAEVIPSLSIIILRDRDAPRFAESPPHQLSIQLSALNQARHILYEPDFFFLDYRGRADTSAPPQPQWIRALTQRASAQHQPDIIDLNALKSQLAARKVERQGIYYVIPPTPVHPYFWSKPRDDISLRITKKQKSFIRNGVITLPHDESDSARAQRREISRAYRGALNVSQAPSTEGLSTLTRFFIIVLWVILGAVGCVLAFLLIRRDRHLSSNPELTRVGTSRPADVAPVDESPVPDPPITPAQADSPTETYTSVKLSRSSDVSPMVDPEQPSTIPAPAATNRDSRKVPLFTEHTQKSARDDAHLAERGAPDQGLDHHSLSDHGLDDHKLIESGAKGYQRGQLSAERASASLPDFVALHEISSIDDFSAPLMLDFDHPDPPYVPTTGTSPHAMISEGRQAVSASEALSSSRHYVPEEDAFGVAPPTLPLTEAHDYPKLNLLAGFYAEAGPMHRLLFLIFHSPCLVGRSPDTQCPLPPSGPRSDRKISREHFELLRLEEGRWELRCLSAQGLMINEILLNLGETALLRDQDLIVLGLSRLRFRCSESWREDQASTHITKITNSHDLIE